MRILLILIVLAFISCNQGKNSLDSIEINQIETKIKSVMNQQSADWSKGDIDAFMEGYWNNDSLRFVGSRGITYGWEQTKANYKKGYPDKSAMGKLEFKINDIDVLSEEAALLLGGYTLFRELDTLSGNFTLTWKKFNDNWLITSDMTCG